MSDGEDPAGEGGATAGEAGDGVVGSAAVEEALPPPLPTALNAGTAGRGDIAARGDSLANVVLNIVRVLLNLPGFPPGVPPPQGFRRAARVKEEEDEEFVGEAAGDEKNAARSSVSLPSLPFALPLASLPPPPPLPPHLLEPFRRQDTRRTSVKSGANALGVLTEQTRRGDRGASAAGDGGVGGGGAIDRLVDGGAVLLWLPGVRGPTDAAESVPRSFFAAFPGW